jgi:hypothetical protein
MVGAAACGIVYAADDLTADGIQPVFTAIALRIVPCVLEVTAMVPLDAAMSVPLLSVGIVPSTV